MREFGEDRFLQPGTWSLWRTGKRRVLLACPLCGQITLINESEIAVADNGMVAETIKCKNKKCVFSDKVALVGWKPDPGVV